MECTIGSYRLKIVPTQVDWKLGVHCAGFPSESALKQWFSRVAPQGWRIAKIYSSVDPQYDQYVHIKKPWEKNSLGPDDLRRDLLEAEAAVAADGPPGLSTEEPPATYPGGAALAADGLAAPPTPEPEPTAGGDASSAPPVSAAESGTPGTAHSLAEAPAEPATLPTEDPTTAGVATESPPSVGSEPMSLLGDLGVQFDALQDGDEVRDVHRQWMLRLEQTRALLDLAAGERLLALHDIDALAYLKRDGVLPLLQSRPPLLFEALLAADAQHDPEFVRTLRRLGPFKAPAEVHRAAARAFSHFDEADSTRREYQSVPDAMLTPEDHALWAQACLNSRDFSAALHHCRLALEGGYLDPELIGELVIQDTGIGYEDKVRLAEQAYLAASERSQLEELQLTLIHWLELVTDHRPRSDSAILHAIACCADVFLTIDKSQELWAQYRRCAAFPAGLRLQILDLLAVTPEGVLPELGAVVSQELATGRHRETIRRGLDMLELYGGDPALIAKCREYLGVKTPPRAPDWSRHSVLLVGAVKPIRQQVREALASRWQINHVEEVPSPWEGHWPTARILQLVDHFELVVVSTAMMKHSLWEQLKPHRKKCLYLDTPGASSALRTIEEFFQSH